MAAEPAIPLAWKGLIQETDGCWVWRGLMRPDGYGKFRGRQAHRVVFEHLNGPIQDGLELDHLCHSRDESCPGGLTCRHRKCVNPEHLEPVTRMENIRRRYELYTHCKSGHEFTPENTYVMPSGHRSCRTCRNEASRRYRQKRSA